MNGCTRKCPDSIGRDITDVEIAWFAHESGDTIYFKDILSNEVFYLVCTSNVLGSVGTFVDVGDCENGGYYIEEKIIDVDFVSNIPHPQNESTKINILLRALNSSNSRLSFYFEGNNSSSDSYIYSLRFDTDSELISSTTDPVLESVVTYKESLAINDKSYTNVFIIAYRKDEEENKRAFFDTLYYNPDGFLKFISSQYGYRLERME